MSDIKIFWFLPTHGDGHYFGNERSQRHPNYKYFKQIAVALDNLGFDGVLIPTGKMFEESWVTGTVVASVTEKLKILVAVRPGIVCPTYAARQTVSLDRASNGRLLLNIVVGGNPVELRADGIFASAEERYAQAFEFMKIYLDLLRSNTVSFTGNFYHIENAAVDFECVQKPNPTIFSAGSSEAGRELAATFSDDFLTWGDPLETVEQSITLMNQKASERNRTLRYGIRVHLIVRETDEEAWKEAHRLLKFVSDKEIREMHERILTEDAVAQRGNFLLHGGDRDKLKIAPNLWAGAGLVRGGATSAIVGSPATVAGLMNAYRKLGVQTFIASGTPHLEEAYRIAELLFPQLGLKN